MKLAQHDEGGQGPIVAYMAPKMDAALDKLDHYTSVRVPLHRVRATPRHSRPICMLHTYFILHSWP